MKDKNRTYREGICIACRNKKDAEFRKNNLDIVRRYNRKAMLKRYYGITIEQHDTILEKQMGMCAIRGKQKNGNRTYLAVDHDHETGEIRGLLCDMCNHGIGRFHDDAKLLRKAIEYLERPGTGIFSSGLR